MDASFLEKSIITKKKKVNKLREKHSKLFNFLRRHNHTNKLAEFKNTLFQINIINKLIFFLRFQNP